ncbi:MAG: transposase, partial [Chthoniobacteraceae bacterium]|nr:transposase [Chthoniobacteraceae bacterium]
MQFQPSFAQSEYAGKKKVTRRDLFLSEMEAVVPWLLLIELIEPFYPKGKRGQPPIGIERMLRVYFLQQWYGLADAALEDAIYDCQAMRHFAGISLGSDPVPDATTVLKFRHLLEEHGLTKKIFEEVGALLSEKQLLMKEGTIVDATIIAATPSTKNKAKERDPEMHQTKKGNQYYFGMKAHIGVDMESGLVYSLTTTAANVADIVETHKLLHGKEKVAILDAGYIGVEKREEIIAKHPEVEFIVAAKRRRIKAMP